MTALHKKVISPVNTEERKNLDIRPGDTVRVWQKIEERDGNIRLQQFEGLVISRKHGAEPGATFTVRRVIDGIGVEKIFPLYSPKIDKIEVLRRAKMRRSKLYHIRDKAARQIKRQMRKMIQVDISTESDIEAKQRAAEEAEKEEEEAANEAGALEEDTGESEEGAEETPDEASQEEPEESEEQEEELEAEDEK